MLLFIHENRGLVPYMLDVCDDLARAGYRVVAPDLLTRLGGTAKYSRDPDWVTTREIDDAVQLSDLIEVYDIVDREGSIDAVVGLCFGAEMGWALITARHPVRAVLLYGCGPELGDVPQITTEVLAVYASDDDRVNGGFPALGRALLAAEAPVTAISYPHTRHAFHDHNRPDRYSPIAAAHVWGEVLGFLDR